jgi:hypothetical protein
MALTLHGANRLLERDIPIRALEGVKLATPLLNEKPLRFKYRGVVIVASMANGTPRIISVWHNGNRKQEKGES